MLDKSIKHIGILMYTHNEFKEIKLKQNDDIELKPYESRFKEDWCQLQCDLWQFENYKEAADYFVEEFLNREVELKEKLLFALDKRTGQIVGTASLWDGKHFGKALPRLHWIAVNEAYQGQGIAKILIQSLIDTYKNTEQAEFIYLTSQTWSYKAINIYKSFGFKAYLGPKPINWFCKDGEFERDSIEAWQLIEDKIAKRR